MSDIVFIAGATGLLGKNIAEKLSESGYKIGIISRNKKNVISEIPYAVSVIETDYSDTDWYNQINGAKAIINLAGTSIAGKRWDENYKKSIYNSRINTTKSIVEAINKCNKKPEVLISASAVGYYGDRGNDILKEIEKPGNDFLAKVCEDWEEESKKTNIRVVNPRIGVVLSTKDGALPQMLTPMKFFAGGPLGSGKQYFPWIHIDDISEFFIWALQNNNAKGAYNLTAPNPPENKDFVKTLGKVISRPSIFPVPKVILKIVLGESSDFILSSLRAVPDKLIEEGFRFKYDGLQNALYDLINNKK